MVTITIKDCKAAIEEAGNRVDFFKSMGKLTKKHDDIIALYGLQRKHEIQKLLWETMLEKLEGQQNG